MTDSSHRTPATRARGRPPKDSGEDVREAILDAATDLFAERGYAATPVNAVCERAGVGKPAVYWHFENKQGLLAAVLERLDKHWNEVRVSGAPVVGPTDGLDRMIEVWRRRVHEALVLLIAAIGFGLAFTYAAAPGWLAR